MLPPTPGYKTQTGKVMCDIKNRGHKLKLGASQWEPVTLRRAVLSLESSVKRKLGGREK
jgi:hypothetical protein